MPTVDLVVSDTSPLLNLALIGRLDLVERQFETVMAPERVWEELVAGEDGVETIEKFRDRGVLQVEAVAETELYVEFRRELDVGEAAALAYAVEADADLVLFDEREARQAARRHDVPITGAIGVLLRSAGDGDVDVREELDALREAGFWISDDLYREALARLDSGE
jgi:predicted nucleic acid-binding protein